MPFRKSIAVNGQGVDADSPVDAEGNYTLPLIMWPNCRIALQRAQWTANGPVTESVTVRLVGPDGTFQGLTLDPDRPILADLETQRTPVIEGDASGWGIFTHKDGHTEEAGWDLTLWFSDDTTSLFATVNLWTEEPRTIWFGKSLSYTLRPNTTAQLTIERK